MNRNSNSILADIHKEYVQHLPQRIEELEQKGWYILQNHPQPEELRAYYKSLHDLAGSCGTHGYKKLQPILRALDKLVYEWVDDKECAIDQEQVKELLGQAKIAAQEPPLTPDMFKAS